MSEHAPISDYDAAAIELFLTTSAARQHSGGGGVLEHLQTVGVAALEDYQAKRQQNSAMRSALVEMGYSSASLPWDLMAITAKPTADDEGAGRSYVEPSFQDEIRRALVSRCRERMSARGRYGHWLVLETYFGHIGRQYEEQPLPRVFSLLHLVTPGRDFLAATQHLLAPSSRGLPAPDRMRSHCRFRDDSKYEPHAETFARAEIAVDRLFRESAEAWNDARQGGR